MWMGKQRKQMRYTGHVVRVGRYYIPTAPVSTVQQHDLRQKERKHHTVSCESTARIIARARAAGAAFEAPPTAPTAAV